MSLSQELLRSSAAFAKELRRQRRLVNATLRQAGLVSMKVVDEQPWYFRLWIWIKKLIARA